MNKSTKKTLTWLAGAGAVLGGLYLAFKWWKKQADMDPAKDEKFTLRVGPPAAPATAKAIAAARKAAKQRGYIQ